MKKFLILLGLIFFVNNSAIAQQMNNNEQNLNLGTMPTDEEILQTIQKYNFDKSQEEFLFRETKKKLEKMYSDPNYANEMLKNGIENQNLPDVEKTDRNIDMPEPAVKNPKKKKYTNHDPLIKRKKK